MNRQHGKITKSALEKREYDIIVHVLNAQRLGTDEEIAHLRWIKHNIQDCEVVFVLNKLDVFKSKEDDINKSIALVRRDLEKIGFINPIVCPISAYFAFLIKQKRLGMDLTEDDKDEYDLYTKKFNKPVYDLSRFYPEYQIKSNDDEATILLKKCGFYGFEKIISGGIKMKKVFIKYNPYKLETKITINDKAPAQNSPLTEKAAQGNRLQEWIEELPEILKNEYNDDSFEIVFHGTIEDYDDIAEVFQKAYNSNVLSYVKLDRIPAKETADKEKLIDDIFKEIIKGPFEELRSDDIKKSFSLAKSEDFEVCVVATMSAGKSTLINSMLGTKLMPSKQEACTAIITRIKDNNSSEWQAEVYDKEEHLIESHDSLTLETMNRLNSDENVSTNKVNRDIPFVQ